MKPINNTLIVGKVLIELEDHPSTNIYAHELLSKNRPIEGTAIIAHNQYSGKGQYGKKWMSQSNKNITMSVILYPNFLKIDDQYYLNKLICNAITEFLSTFEISASIKWPNDIYVGNKKIGGNLIENSVSLKFLSSSIIGVGLNVNQIKFEDDLINPTSMAILKGKEYDIEDCIERLLSFIEKWFFLLKNGDLEQIDAYFHEHLYRVGEVLSFKYRGNSERASFIGVDRSGKIRLSKEKLSGEYSNHEVEIDWLGD